jgi:hypothetical protein
MKPAMEGEVDTIHRCDDARDDARSTRIEREVDTK